MKKLILPLVFCLLFSGAFAEDLDSYALKMYGMTREEISDGLRVVSLASGFYADDEEAAWRNILKGELDIDAQNVERLDADSLDAAMLMLETGRADVMEAPKACAEYITARNAAVGYLDDPLYTCDLSMAFRADNEDLCGRVNAAIADMKAEGVIDEIIAELAPAAAIGGYSETIYVGVSGGVPPYDYVSAAGEPAGFNVAFLSELAERLSVNVELVTVTGTSYQAALASGKIDAYFCCFTEGFCGSGEYVPNVSGEREALSGLLLFSDVYISDTFCLLMSKERADRGAEARAR